MLFWLYCPGAHCGLSGPARLSTKEAISAWNAISVKARGRLIINIPEQKSEICATIRFPDGNYFQINGADMEYVAEVGSDVAKTRENRFINNRTHFRLDIEGRTVGKL
jgi:hypothetical protein